MKVFLCLLVVLLCPSAIFAAIQFTLNPNCTLADCEEIGRPAIYYANHFLGNRTIHIVFSSLDQLTINIFDTNNKAVPSFNYAALFAGNYSGAIQFEKDTVLYNSFAIILRRLIQFNDPKDTGRFSTDDPTLITYDLTNIGLANTSNWNASTDKPSFQLSIPSVNGTLDVDVLFPGEQMRDDQFPKLQISDEGYYLNLVFQANGYNNSKTRFGMELYLMSFDKAGLRIFSSRYIDDQYTPGIFSVWQLKTLDDLYKSSMLWKPVVYFDDTRSIEQNTLMQIYPIQNDVALKDNDQGIYRSFYKPAASYVSSFNVSWGQANDGERSSEGNRVDEIFFF